MVPGLHTSEQKETQNIIFADMLKLNDPYVLESV